jgi:serine/threonine-protein kinase RIO1
MREVGNYLSDVHLFKHSIEDLSEACVSMTLNQIKVKVTDGDSASVYRAALRKKKKTKRVTIFRIYSSRDSRDSYSCRLIRFGDGKMMDPKKKLKYLATFSLRINDWPLVGSRMCDL